MNPTLTHLALAALTIGALAGLMASGTISPNDGLPALLSVAGVGLGASAVAITPGGTTTTKKDN